MAGVDLGRLRHRLDGAAAESGHLNGADGGTPARWHDDPAWLLALAITLCAGLVRLLIGATTPLFPDETYYWEWSRRLAPGYFDHPPMIAWLVRAGTAVAGHTALGVRLGPILAGTLAGLFIAAGARRLAGSRSAITAAAVFALMPLSAAGLILATPDAPLFACAAGMVVAALRALEHPPRTRGAFAWWCVAGVALGFGMASKYTAVLLPAGLLLGILSQPAVRAHAWSPGPWVGLLVAGLVFLPIIAWNATHDWVSFTFQLRHGLVAVGGSAMKRQLDLLGGQAGLVTPVLFVMMVVAAVKARRPERVVLSACAALVFAFFMYSATKRRPEANWPALAYVPGTLLLATFSGGAWWRRWMPGGMALAALVTGVTYVNTYQPILPVPARRDPVARAVGWDHLAAAVQRVRLSNPVGARQWVAADRYQEASELAFHLPDRPVTFSLNLTSRPNHYDLWPPLSATARVGDAVILVVDEVAEAHPTVELLRPHFASITPDAMVTLARDGDPVKFLRIWVLHGWLGSWPEDGLRSRP